MQIATIEFARNVCGFEHANSTEFDPGHSAIPSYASSRTRETSQKKALRCDWEPALPCSARTPSPIRSMAAPEIFERHRHRYEFNMDYREADGKEGIRHFRHLARRCIGRTDRNPESSVVSCLPVPSRVPIQAQRSTPALQGPDRRLSRAPGLRQALSRRTSLRRTFEAMLTTNASRIKPSHRAVFSPCALLRCPGLAGAPAIFLVVSSPASPSEENPSVALPES